VYPALSILQALATRDSLSASKDFALQTLWVGGEGGMEADLVRRAGIDFKAIPAAGVHGVGLKALPGNLVKLARGLLASLRILAEFRPQVLLFTGGFVAVPMAFASRLAFWGKNRPRHLVYIPDIEPGLALKALLWLSDHTALTNPDSKAFLSASLPSTVTGYPVRTELLNWKERSQALQALNLVEDLPVLLVMGGSKGARSINRALMAALPVLLPRMQIVHLTGQLDWPEVQQAADKLPADLRSNYHPYPYLHAEMGAALLAADLAVGRAGASCLGEFPLFGTPAILVPYPFAWRYQRVNADYLVRHGAAVMLKDADLKDQFTSLVTGMFDNPDQLREMRKAMAQLAQPEAAGSIANILVNLAAA